MEGISSLKETSSQTRYAVKKQKKTPGKAGNTDKLFHKLKNQSNFNFDARQELMRIASASTRSQVKLILTRLGSTLSRLKGDRDNADLVKKIKKVMAKASKKMKHLLLEERIAEKAKQAEKKRQLEESRRIREGLSQRKTHRKLKELDDVKNADLITATGTNYAPAPASCTAVDSSANTGVDTTGISIEV